MVVAMWRVRYGGGRLSLRERVFVSIDFFFQGITTGGFGRKMSYRVGIARLFSLAFVLTTSDE